MPEIEDFYSHLNMENFIDADYAQAKRNKTISSKQRSSKWNR